jgi:hypothetical protein
MDFIYLNSNRSGLGDRLFDLILIYTYAKYLGCNKIYLNWTVDNDDMVGNNSVHSRLRGEKSSFRKNDYILDNLLKYIELPNDIIFVSKQELESKKNNINVVFDEYMGLRFNINEFINIYLDNKNSDDKENFINSYYNNYKLIKFKNIPGHIIDIFNNNEVITIHLRRGDKVIDDNGECNGVNFNEINQLNSDTKNFINKCIQHGYRNICFISDEKKIKEEYIREYTNKCNVINISGDDVSQTYYDLYALSHSKKILKSQVFSVFSMLGSMIGSVNLYYLYNKSKMNQFTSYRYFKYKDNF